METTINNTTTTTVDTTNTPTEVGGSTPQSSATPMDTSNSSTGSSIPVSASATSIESKGKNRARESSNEQASKRHKSNNGAKSQRSGEVDEKDASGDEDGGNGTGGSSFGKKRKVALAVMYRGTNYNGLQLQNGVQSSNTPPTVERMLMDAIFAAGGISPSNMNETTKIKWQRAARTDKGVHAAGNILSLMLVPDEPPPPNCKSQSLDIVDRINAHLPDDIRVIGYARTLGGFHSKYACTSRVYEYIIPSFVFDERPETIALMHSQDTNGGEGMIKTDSAGKFEYPQELLNYRLTPEKIASIRKITAQFKGTLNYQNFTRKKSSFLKEQAKDKDRPKWTFQKDGKGKNKDKDADASEDEGEGMDDEAEEAFERQMFAKRQEEEKAKEAATAAAASDTQATPATATSSIASTTPSPFTVVSSPYGSQRTHNLLYTNLKSTANSKGGDPTSQTNKVSGQYARFIRYIIDFDIEDTYVYQSQSGSSSSSSSSVSGLELVRFRIHGQSFMLNQIRKMIGLVILVARGQLPESYIMEKAFKYDEYPVPTAPSLGLLLQRPVYDRYDKSVKGNPDRPTIESLFCSEPYKSRVDAFRSQWIYQQIGESEMSHGSAYHWCSRLWNNPAVLQEATDRARDDVRIASAAAGVTAAVTTATAIAIAINQTEDGKVEETLVPTSVEVKTAEATTPTTQPMAIDQQGETVAK